MPSIVGDDEDDDDRDERRTNVVEINSKTNPATLLDRANQYARYGMVEGDSAECLPTAIHAPCGSKRPYFRLPATQRTSMSNNGPSDERHGLV